MSEKLAKSYLEKCEKRLKAIEVLFKEEDWSDVVRESQEVVELSLKAIRYSKGITVPKWHDVGKVLILHKDKLPKNYQKYVGKLATISRRLRKERELSFYGALDFIPTEEYTKKDAEWAFKSAKFCVKIAKEIIKISQ